jgi:cell division protein FtsZ
VTKPFHFEGVRRMRTGEAGIAEIRKHVDTLIVIPNQNLFRVANEKTTFAEAFVLADQVLYSGVACIVDLIIKEGLINLDFADVRTIMSGMGSAVMGTGEASGERRATLAAEEAIANPLLDEVSLKGARGLLLSITGGNDLTLYEVDEAASRVRQEVDPDANIIVGATFDDTLGDRVRVSIVASGMVLASEGSQPVASPSEVRLRAAKAAAAAAVAGDQATPPPLSAEESEDDLRRRLSDAIGSGNGNIRSPSASGREQTAPPRESWRAPGDVVIEEGFSHLTWLAQSARARAREGEAPSEQAREFKPARPTDVRRGTRRIPEVEDFPPIAQQEYRAKVGPGEETPPRVPGAGLVTDSLSRLGLLQRIMGRPRHPDEAEAEDLTTRSFDDSYEPESLTPSEDEGWWEADETAQSDVSAERPSTVPAIFNRLRK